MAGEWKVLVDTEKVNKRFVRIEDIPNKRIYENYFPVNASNTAVKNRFKNQVKEHRAEIAAKKNISDINLTNFEASL